MLWTVTSEEAGQRLDHFVASKVGCSHAEARRLIEEKRVKLRGASGRKGARLVAGQEIDFVPAAVHDNEPQAQPELPLTVLLEDTDLVALDKPAGWATHPLRPGELGTLANALVARYPECRNAATDLREAGMCHRLDRFTSGVIVAARTSVTWEQLRNLFSHHQVEKKYLAVVAGKPTATGEVIVPLRQLKTKSVADFSGDPKALAAHTRFKTLVQGDAGALVLAESITGRMHQIRAHLAFVGHPLIGDTLYGGSDQFSESRPHFLHALTVDFAAASGKKYSLRAPVSELTLELIAAAIRLSVETIRESLR